MQFVTLKELSNLHFNVQNVNLRAPMYKENYTYHIGDAPYRTYSGIIYLKNCDMTTTLLDTQKKYEFKKNSLILLPEFSKYYSTFNNISKNDTTFYCINMNLYSNDFKKIIVEKEPVMIFKNTPESISNHIEQLFPKTPYPSLCSSQTFMLWHLIFKNLYPQNSLGNTNNPIDYINFHKSNEELAAELNVSVSTLIRMFKKYYNSTPGAYGLKAKIENAKFQLKNTNKSVNQIALNLGFNSPEHFSRIFKKHTGLSPTKYRNSHS